MTRLALLVALLAPLSFAAGCAQGVGERCQVQSDCQDGLVCVLQAGATPQSGGICEEPTTVGADMAMTPTPDLAGVILDMSPAPSDLTPAGD